MTSSSHLKAKGAGPAGPVLTVTVYGTPAPQGSKRHLGKGVMVESSKAVKPWREAVKHAALDLDTRVGPLAGPLSLELVFTVPKPKSAPKRRTTWPAKKPDLDKLARSTLDGLGEAGVWDDDAQVVELAAAKVYPDEGVDALPIPGAVIRVWRVGGGL